MHISRTTITSAYRDALKQFADRLPATHQAGGRPRLGAEMLAEFPDMKGPAGELIDPTQKYYTAARGTATNHLKQLVAAYEQGGQPAVIAYLKPYQSFLQA